MSRIAKLSGFVSSLILATAYPAVAQTPTFKGIFEPVSYNEDLQLNGVYFVTVDEGWVTGGKGAGAGVLLHTTDAGDHWTVAMGDPAGSQRPFYNLRFVDQTTGFVVQGTPVGEHALLRTTDGKNWEVAGSIPGAAADYRFISATTGVAALGTKILRTTNAGRAWTPAFDCALKIQVDGLARTVPCQIAAFAFPSPNVGYAVGGGYAVRGLYVLKTEDGGATWSGSLPVPGNDDGIGSHVFFVDEKNGYVCLANGKIFGTGDGGQTWTGLPGATCESKAPILFADPEVGWAVRYSTLTWTTEGGKRWVSRKVALPAFVNAFSLPRRDRGYVVGDHGMVFRYRIVPVTTQVANAVEAPAMPGFSTALVDQTAALGRVLAGLDTNVAGGAGAGAARGGGGGAGGAAGVVAAGATAAAAGAGSEPQAPFISDCCAKRLGALELVLRAVGSVVPDYTSKYKNLNLLTLGIRTAGALPQRADSLRTAVRAFRTATDRAAADQALTGIKAALAAFRAVADTAVQVKP